MTRRKVPVPGDEYLSLRPGSSVWQIDFTVGSRRHRSSSGTRVRADAAALAHVQVTAAWREHQLGERPTTRMSLEAALERHGEATSPAIAAVLLRGLGGETPLSALTDNLIDRLVARWLQEDQLAPATVNRYLTGLSMLCERARTVWGVEVGPWSRKHHAQKEPRGRETFLDHGQAQRLLNKIVPHARPIVLLDLMTGLRRSNAIGLAWDQVALDQGRATMIQKGGKPLTVVLIGEAVSLLQAVQPDANLRTGPVWRFDNPNVPCRCPHCSSPLYRGEPIRSIRRSFSTAAKSAGITGGLRFHDLRHTFASWLLANSGDLKLVQEALGHADVSTTGRYAHLLPGRKEAAMAGAVAGLFRSDHADRKT